MTPPWFRQEGSQGVLALEQRTGTWILAESGGGDDVKCFFDGDEQLEYDEEPVEVRCTVESYRSGQGNRPDFLFLSGVTSEFEERSVSKSDAVEPEGELESIAKEILEDDSYSMEKEKAESLVGKAKSKARSQGRDPAVDPNLQD